MRRVLMLALFFAVAACGKDAAAPSDLAGTYALQSVNGHALPAFDRSDALARYEITGGTLTLTDHTWRHEVQWRVTTAGGVSQQTTGGLGTYAAVASGVRFDGGDGMTGTVAAGAVTLSWEGRALVYRR